MSINSNNKSPYNFLVDKWDNKYDSIICNPPYNKFQVLDDREYIFSDIEKHLKIKISGYCNQYVLFLMKCIYLLNNNGRLAFIVPNEFLNTGYGTCVKKYLLDNKCLQAIISFDNNVSVFDKALTTCCILLIEKTNNKDVLFSKLTSPEELDYYDKNNCKIISYHDLDPKTKWGKYFENDNVSYKNLIHLSNVAKVKRGIATGSNEFFILNESKRKELKLTISNLNFCASKCSDFKSPIFNEIELNKMIKNDKNIYLFDGSKNQSISSKKYIEYGERIGVNKKFLTSHRNPWYSCENKAPSPIWINVFSRNHLKVVRNKVNILNLTTFHSVYMNNGFDDLVDILFCYLLTPVGQEILYLNKRQYGDGLDKFEPNDLNNAQILNLSIISEEDKTEILKIYGSLNETKAFDVYLEALNKIFLKYLKSN